MRILACLWALWVLSFSIYSQNRRSDWEKQNFQGPVKTCKIVCYQYVNLPDGSRSLERGLLEFAGNAYAVDYFTEFNPFGYIVLEHTLQSDCYGCYEHRTYIREDDNRIQKIYVKGEEHGPISIERYYYDDRGLLAGILQEDVEGQIVDTLHQFQYDHLGNRKLVWKEDEMTFYIVLDSLDQCIEECAILPGGEEHYRNYHQYDLEGKRVKTTFTQDNQIMEIRQDPFTDNVLDEGVVATTDDYGNWVTKVFPRDDKSGSIVVREIFYFD